MFTKETLLNRRKRNYWTKEKCLIIALKYNHRWEYQKYDKASYFAARRNKWLNDICKHMIRPIQHNKKWTKEKCANEALKYDTRSDFEKKSLGGIGGEKLPENRK